MSKIQEVYAAVERGKVKQIASLVQEALDEGDAPLDILTQGMIASIDSVGAKFKSGDFFVPDMLIAAKCMKKGVEILKPH
ncbi:MAG: B12-binding domain-containing protein, partial [Blautia sp.]